MFTSRLSSKKVLILLLSEKGLALLSLFSTTAVGLTVSFWVSFDLLTLLSLYLLAVLSLYLLAVLSLYLLAVLSLYLLAVLLDKDIFLFLDIMGALVPDYLILAGTLLNLIWLFTICTSNW